MSPSGTHDNIFAPMRIPLYGCLVHVYTQHLQTVVSGLLLQLIPPLPPRRYLSSAEHQRSADAKRGTRSRTVRWNTFL